MSEQHYYPFGLTFGGNLWMNDASDVDNRYQFNGKELTNDHGLDWLDYGTRWFDPGLGRWNTVDPLAEKYPQWSPYTYCFNNPLIYVDPDGKEGIVVSGSPGDHVNKEHFLVNGLDRAKAAQNHTQKKDEKVTWIVYNDKKNGFTQKQLDKYADKAAKSNINFKVVTSTDEIVDYVNEKDGGDSRKSDQITSFYYVGHSKPGDLSVGYKGTGENFEPDDFNSDAFASGAHINLVGGCRTSVPGFFEDSNVTQFAEILDEKSTIYGSNVRVYYSGGVIKDADLVKKNNGKIVERKGELPTKKKVQ